MRVKSKELFLFTYAITIICRSLIGHEYVSVPYTPVYLAFILFWGTYALINTGFKISINKDPASKVLVLLTAYFIIWGLYNIHDLDFSDTMTDLIRSLLMMGFVIVTAFWIKKLDCLGEFVKTSFYSLAVLMLASFFIFFRNTSIIASISTFWIPEEWMRTRNLFGFISNNVAAELAMSVILLSKAQMSFSDKKPKKMTLYRLAIIFVDLIMVLIIIMNNSRGTAIALIIMSLFFIIVKASKKYGIRKIIRACCIIVLCCCAVLLYYINVKNVSVETLLQGTNRAHFLDNIEALKSGNKWMMGLGLISGAYFKEGHLLYGIKLNYMEIFYIRVFVTSGIIGSILIAYIIFNLLKGIYVTSIKSSTGLEKWIFVVFGYMLFISMFETYLFSGGYISQVIFLTIIVSYLQIEYSRKSVSK